MSHRRIIQIALVSICSLLIAGLAVTNATANLSGCDNCVEAGDIATGAVNAAELDNDLDDSITANDIADGAINKGELSSDSVGLSELLDSVTQGVGTIALAGSTTSTSPDTLDTFTVSVPGSGRLLVRVDGAAHFEADAGEGPDVARFARGLIGICETVDSDTDCGDSYLPLDYEDPDDSNSANALVPFTRSRVVLVSSPGVQTFYLNGETADGAESVNLAGGVDGYATATAVFAPTLLPMATP